MTPEERISAFNVRMELSGIPSQHAEDCVQSYRDDCYRWLLTDYGAGHGVFHSVYMMYRARKSEDELSRNRLATDLRFLWERRGHG
ncbi:MAG: hypothetical protein M1837_007116 [Sclerophora amabilis]|nr:MAG: hypothetical protein M1837_007116 [Sclerophora amabilis]